MRPAHGALVAQRLKHLADRLEIRLVEIAGGVGIGEADGAGQIAAVGQVDVGEAGVAGVEVAQAAIVGAAGGVGDDGVFEAAVVAEGPFLHFQVQPGVGIDDVAEVAVFGAALLHDDLAGVFKDSGVNQLPAIGAEGLGGFGQAIRQRRELASPYK